MKVSTLASALSGALLIPSLFAQLNENCTVSISNRTAQVRPDGTWTVPGVPLPASGADPLRARATCLENGVPVIGESPSFTGVNLGAVGLPEILIGTSALIPSKVTVTAPVTKLTAVNQTAALTITGTFADNSTKDLTPSSTGTTYRISNSNLATISPEGVVTAKATGTVLIQALNEGTQGLLLFSIALTGDSDGDGIPDDVEIANGLDPNNPADAGDDPDHDGLTNLEEFRAGTDMHNPDTDGDGLLDGQEVKVLHTNPLLKDTDGDGVPDNIEVATGSDPNNPSSFNLAAALSGIRVSPASFTLNTSPLGGTGLQQLTVTGDFKLGGSIDLTLKSKGTSYTSSAPSICTFGVVDGKVIAGANGSCIITIANNGFTATASGTVNSFAVQALSKITLPGYPNGVEATGNFAYVAVGAAGVVIVDATDPVHPAIAGTVDTPGNANAIRVIGKYAFVADGTSGLQVIDVSHPNAPVIVGSAQTHGEALDLTILKNRVYVADGNSGVAVISITNPADPHLIAQIPTPGKVRAVDLLPETNGTLYAIVADDVRDSRDTTAAPMIRVIDVTNLTSATIVASVAATAQTVRVAGSFAFNINQVISLANPLAPAIVKFANNFTAKDATIFGRTFFFADAGGININVAAMFDITDPIHPGPIVSLDYGSLFPAGTQAISGAVAVKGTLAFVTVIPLFEQTDEKGFAFVTNPPSLAILRFFPPQDGQGIAPAIVATDPPGNSSVLAGSTIPLSALVTDDLAVNAVTFQVNGVTIPADDSQPYSTMFTVPAGATSLAITTQASDFGNNVATFGPSMLTVVADPLTLITGRVVRSDGSTVAGASVTCFASTASTNSSGQFNIPNFPIANGEASCTASITENGRLTRGTSATLALIPSGTTNAGDITIRKVAKVLMLTSKTNQTAASIAEQLHAAGSDVTVRPPPQTTWDNTNPAASNFDCIVHLNGGANFSFTFSAATRQALVDYVHGGGGYIGFAPSTADDANPSVMRELMLFPGTNTNNGTSQLVLNYTKTPGQESHPVTAGFGSIFPVSSREQTKTATTFFSFTQDQPFDVLNTLSGNHAVAVRQLGSGRVVRFALGDSFQDNGAPNLVVPDANLLKLVVNATGWACGQQ